MQTIPFSSLLDGSDLMKEYPVFSLDAVLRKDLSSHTKLFRIEDMEYFLWVKVDPEIARSYRFYELDEVDGNKKDINIADICSHEPNRIWYKFNSMLLNREQGLHTYRMHMVNKYNETTISLYFSYVVQRTDVNKEYVYMKDEKDDPRKKVILR